MTLKPLDMQHPNTDSDDDAEELMIMTRSKHEVTT